MANEMFPIKHMSDNFVIQRVVEGAVFIRLPSCPVYVFGK